MDNGHIKKIKIFDTTLRDGEQSPGASMNTSEKLNLARQLARLGVNVIEAGFPIASEGDFEAVKAIAQEIKGVEIAGLARANEKDIYRAYSAVKYSEKPVIHTFIATSDIHLKHKLKMTREDLYEKAVSMVKYAKSFIENIEFSAEDATRTDMNFLCEVIEGVIAAGATTVNIPDTVGFATPFEFYDFIKNIRERVKGIKNIILSVHCHNDLGLGVANSLAAIQAGVGQVECTINGIGERAGNAALEEIVMALDVRKDIYNAATNINTAEIYRSSQLLTHITGISVQPNKAIVGKNAFAHEAGIHQDGVLKEKTTYEIMTPERVGRQSNDLVLGKHSGKHAFKEKLESLGYLLNDKEIEDAFVKFKALSDRKKEIYDEDIDSLIAKSHSFEKYELKYVNVVCGDTVTPLSMVKVMVNGELKHDSSCGNGPVDAAINAIEKIVNSKARVIGYEVKSIRGTTEAQGDVSITIEENGTNITGRSAHTDIVVASAKAYVNAINKLYIHNSNLKKSVESEIYE
ncbi:MAG: 2-isopropylmalate synthase [Candidatus Acidulodesulfobacterium ferriphilum]|uniref:2-isopropylmalate synthase n=1 Tax=Candidatus Acidulodesulfobacterium ferriphilum TaxID=2597223 RepID=A0A519BCS8_9DELT|nr:MAG: 2-isopropylmalate synthase [Candidatus Acidulodesulfobacterium ferriphilum]